MSGFSKGFDPLEQLFSVQPSLCVQGNAKRHKSEQHGSLVNVIPKLSPLTHSDQIRFSPKKPRSAMQAALEAQQIEKENKEKKKYAKTASVNTANSVDKLIQALLRKNFPTEKVKVLSTDTFRYSEQNIVLWKAHRQKFLSEGRLDLAHESAKILAELERKTSMLTVLVRLEGKDHLVCISHLRREVVAVLMDGAVLLA